MGAMSDPIYKAQAFEIAKMAENVRTLEAENATLRTQLTEATESMGRMGWRCAKLQDLLADCLGAPCIDCDPWDEGFEGCRHCDGGDCTLVARAHKLGVEARE